MQPHLTVSPLPRWSNVIDRLLLPIMHVLTGTFFFKGEAQRTHRWHLQSVSDEESKQLDHSWMVKQRGDQDARARHILGFVPLCHIPILGGWRRFVVLEPVNPIGAWHVGWLAKDSRAINRLRLSGQVKMLIGPGKVAFFGIDAKTGEQIPLRLYGAGRLWGRRYRRVPLL